MRFSKRSKPLVALMPLSILCATSACVKSTTETVRSVSDYALIAAPITYADGKDIDGIDTAETVAQIKKHNSRYECVVNKDCPAIAR